MPPAPHRRSPREAGCSDCKQRAPRVTRRTRSVEPEPAALTDEGYHRPRGTGRFVAPFKLAPRRPPFAAPFKLPPPAAPVHCPFRSWRPHRPSPPAATQLVRRRAEQTGSPMPRRARQLELPRTCTWGGARQGAGRRPPNIAAARPTPASHRASRGLPGPHHPAGSRRSEVAAPAEIFTVIRRALAASSNAGFRVLHFSVQDDHLHLIVEANDTNALALGVAGIKIRLARAINRVLARRGPVWAGPLSRPLPAHAARGPSRPASTSSRTGKSTAGIPRASTGARPRLGSTGGRSDPFHLLAQVRSRRQEHGSRRSAGVDAPQGLFAKTRRQRRTR